MTLLTQLMAAERQDELVRLAAATRREKPRRVARRSPRGRPGPVWWRPAAARAARRAD